MMQIAIRDLVAPFGVRASYYNKACRFSTTIGQYGVEPTGIECLPNARPGFRLGRKGFRLALCSGEREYEILLDRDWVKLRLVPMHLPLRILSEGGAASQSTWDRFVQIIKEWEDR